MAEVSENAAGREQALADMVRRSQKTQTFLTLAGAALAIVAIAIAGYVAFQIGNMQQQPAANSPTEVQTPNAPAPETPADPIDPTVE